MNANLLDAAVQPVERAAAMRSAKGRAPTGGNRCQLPHTYSPHSHSVLDVIELWITAHAREGGSA
jgi:hypothetical protein